MVLTKKKFETSNLVKLMSLCLDQLKLSKCLFQHKLIRNRMSLNEIYIQDTFHVHSWLLISIISYRCNIIPLKKNFVLHIVKKIETKVLFLALYHAM